MRYSNHTPNNEDNKMMKAHDLPRNSVVAVCYRTGAVSAFLYVNSRDQKAHDLPRNSVVAVCYRTGAVSAFLYVNSRDQISPFWYSGRSPYKLETFGELNKLLTRNTAIMSIGGTVLIFTMCAWFRGM
ncbi:hypothetical protein KMB89_gp03 [Citrobacter phage HCF1]|uniref:Uncharacterized protein n=1 Tax=Citrobacter phage HCF1 TaxID=2849700 RepID=A0ABX6D3X3_9CAUD|nr:hypothetical protein KMB89_gp03 [Citrobacter phage HCF1]